MFNRNQLAHLVFWPQNAKANYALVNSDGEAVSTVKVSEPILGSLIARTVPQGFHVSVGSVIAVTMSGEVRIGGKAPFDTETVTERSKPTVEERMDMLERRESFRLKRQELMEKKLFQKQKESENEVLEETADGTVGGTVQPEGASEDAAGGRAEADKDAS